MTVERGTGFGPRGRGGDPDGLTVDLGRGSAPGNGARHPARLPAQHPARRALRTSVRFAGAAFAALLAGAAAGCSLSGPVAELTPDADATGSIDRTAAMLSPGLDGEDLRRARAAMAAALDPQGDGARAAWQNPRTGAHGGFAASASPFVDHDRVCRRFTGDVVPAGGGRRRLSGSACRDGDGAWRMTG